MNDYTPTTEEVRETYADAHCPDLYVGHEDSCPADPEFDRWLATVKAEAWDEGHHAGRLNETYRDHTRNFWRTPPTNPYRKETL